jgi:hypothetical protein
MSGGEGPLSPLERMRLAGKRKIPRVTPEVTEPESAPDAPPLATGERVRLLSRKSKRPERGRRQEPEKYGYQSLLYPLLAWRLCLALAVVLTLATASLALFLPELLDEPPADPWAQAGLYLLVGVIVGGVLIGLPSSFLESVLLSAMEGEVPYIRWSGNIILAVLFSALRWMACFLAGPILFAAIGWLYWVNCGDPTTLDWLILTELGMVGIGYGIFALLSITERGRLRDLNPLAVIDLAHQLGGRAVALVLVAALVAMAHGWVMLAGVEGVQESTGNGWGLLFFGWISAIYWGTFFCRLLGLWCFRSRQVAVIPEGEA